MSPKPKIDLTKYTPTAWPIKGTIDSPLNKREDYGDIESLAESLRKKGVECALLARPTDDPNVVEIVWGKRRRRAAQIAGITMLPLVIRVMSDLEVLDAQFTENQDRKDFTPLEEASLYRSYVADHKLTIEQIAERISRARGYVLRRLKLLDLITHAQEAVAIGPTVKGGMELAAAEHLACYPATVQDLALPHMVRTEATSPMSGAAARAWLADKFTLKLAKPPFDPEDAGLVPAAGACSKCPKRTGNQSELFADLAEDTCTEPACYDTKGRAAWVRKAEEYSSKGFVVLGEEDTREAFGGKREGSGWLSAMPVSSRYVSLDDRVRVGDTEKTYRQIFGGKSALKNAKVVIARHPETGRIFELLDVREAAAFAEERKAEGKLAEVPTVLEKHTATAKDERRAEKLRERAQRHVNAFVMGSIVSGVAQTKKLDADLWRLIARLAVDAAARDVLVAVAERRELVDKDDSRTLHEVLHAHIEQLTIGGAIGIVFEINATRGLTVVPTPELKRDGVLGQTAKLLDMEWSALLRDAKKDAAALGTSEPKKREKQKAAKKSPTTDPKAGACRVCGCTERDPCGPTTDPCYWHEEPTKTTSGLCSMCGEPIAAIIEALRPKKGKVRIAALLDELGENSPDIAEILADKKRFDAVLAHLAEEGAIWRDTKDVLLERDPDEQDEQDEQDEDDESPDSSHEDYDDSEEP